jgi:hypothetical protein
MAARFRVYYQALARPSRFTRSAGAGYAAFLAHPDTKRLLIALSGCNAH